jgi:hypothetical protein
MLTSILTDGIQAWFTEATLQPGTYPHASRQLIIQEQNEISCRQFFNCQIANKWQRLQNEHLQQQGITTISLTGQSWSTAMIVTVWKEYFELWEQHTTTWYMAQISPAKTWQSAAKHLHKSNKSNLNKMRSSPPTNPACLCAIQKLTWTVI